MFLGFYRPRKLGHNFPRLYDIVEGESIATAFLQLNPDDRIGAEEALKHPYFAPLPKKLYELPDGLLIYLFLLYCYYYIYLIIYFVSFKNHQYLLLRVYSCIQNQIDRINETN